MTPQRSQRREFLGQLAAGAVAVVMTGAGAREAFASTTMPAYTDSPTPSDRWLSLLTGENRQLFDIPDPGNGMSLFHVSNYLDTYRDFYHLTHPAVTAVVTLYNGTTMLAFNDAMWKKYDLGKPAKVMDGSNSPATSNVFYKAPSGAASLSLTGAPIPIPSDASISALQARGAMFLLCNNAFHGWMHMLAAKTGSNPDALANEFLANVLPGVQLVPAMVIAIGQAQKHGCSYMHVA
jgi:intracellular sulfur oxidation DsrE/DsrF family protein